MAEDLFFMNNRSDLFPSCSRLTLLNVASLLIGSSESDLLRDTNKRKTQMQWIPNRQKQSDGENFYRIFA